MSRNGALLAEVIETVPSRISEPVVRPGGLDRRPNAPLRNECEINAEDFRIKAVQNPAQREFYLAQARRWALFAEEAED